MGNTPSTKIIPSREKLTKVNVQGNAKRYVVVFDIDNTLCKSELSSTTTEAAKNFHQECPLIEWKHEARVYGHLFLPHLQILFGYLIDQDARIVFYSSAIKERNLSVVPELLSSFWGKEKYEKLKLEGQFDIFSREALRAGHSIGEEGVSIKDLNVVVQDMDSLLDCILVEDDTSYAAYDQKPCLFIINLNSWDLPYDKEEQCMDSYCKNSTYYMLGLFKTYFEQEEYKKLPLRVGLDQILPRDNGRFESFFPKSNQFAFKMMQLGLEEVQKKVPSAIMYKLNEREKRRDRFHTSRKQKEDKVSKETKYDSFVRNLRIGNIPLSMYYLATHLFEKFQSLQSTGTNQSAEFYQESIVNLIGNLKSTADNDLIEVGHKIYDVCFIVKDRFSYTRTCIPLSFTYVPYNEELENTARVTLKNIQPLVDIKRACYNKIISVGIAYTAKSLLAAYTDHYNGIDQVYLTDIYVN